MPPNENAACIELSTRRPRRRSTATPSTFMATSRMPLASPMPNSTAASAGTDGAAAATGSPSA